MPTEEENVAELDRQAQIYADDTGKDFDTAKEELGALLTNMEKDPTGTALYFARRELAQTEALEEVKTTVSNLEARIAALEEVDGGTNVGGG